MYVESLPEKEVKLYEIRVLIDGEEFAKFEVTAQQGGMFTTIVENYLDDPDWHTW